METSKIKNNNSLEEIDLRSVFKALVQITRVLNNSKKILIASTLVSILIAFSYIHLKGSKYESSAIVEIGVQNIIAYDLMNHLNMELVFKQKMGHLELTDIGDRFIQLNSISVSEIESEDVINNTLTYIKKYMQSATSSHMSNLKGTIELENDEIMQEFETEKIKFLYEISLFNKQIEFNKKNIIEETNERLVSIDNLINSFEIRIGLLKEIIIDEQDNLEFIQSSPELLLIRASQHPSLEGIIYSYEEKLVSEFLEMDILLQEKSILEKQLKSEEIFNTEEIFGLYLEIDRQEKHLQDSNAKFLKSQEIFRSKQEKINYEISKIKTVNGIQTNQINNKILPYFITVIFGLIFAFIIIFFRAAYSQKD